MLRVLFFWALLGLVAIYAFRRGGSPERVVAGTFLAGATLSILSVLARRDRFFDFELAIFAIDGAMLIVLGIVAFKARRQWTLPVFAIQILIVTAHILRWVTPEMAAWYYWADTVLWAYLQIVLLAIGTWRGQKITSDGSADAFSEPP